MGRSWFLWLTAGFGFVFLWVPIVSVVVYSFNASKLVTVWAGFSTKWYGELLRDEQVISAVWVSLRVALISASLAVVFGTLAAFVLVRFGAFWGKPVLRGMTAAPLVMPEVLLGLSLLLLYVSMEQALGWPKGRGVLTIVIAHTTFCLAYVAVIVQSRLTDMDESLEEAARDLGAGPVRVFFDITLPVIAPALVAGWLLAFTLSLDDLVVASFATGPGASTLPIVIFSKVRLGVSPEINALATIILGVVAAGVVLAGLMMRKRGR